MTGLGPKADIGRSSRDFPESGHSITALCESSPSFESAKTQSSNRIGDLNRILLVSMSAPTGMTDRNMINVVPRAFARSDAPQGDHFPSLNLKASYFIERASDCGS